jgi:hypothetical protein
MYGVCCYYQLVGAEKSKVAAHVLQLLASLTRPVWCVVIYGRAELWCPRYGVGGVIRLTKMCSSSTRGMP